MTSSQRDEPVWFGTTDPNQYADRVGVAVCPDADTLTAIQITVGQPDSGERLTTSLTVADAEQLAAALPGLIDQARQRLLAQLHAQQQASTDQYQAKLGQLQSHSADPTSPPPPAHPHRTRRGRPGATPDRGWPAVHEQPDRKASPMTRRHLPILSDAQREGMNPSLLDVVEYRKSGLSLNHVMGCPGVLSVSWGLGLPCSSICAGQMA